MNITKNCSREFFQQCQLNMKVQVAALLALVVLLEGK